MHEAIYLVVGGFIAGIVGIVVDWVNRKYEEKREIEHTCRALRVEIEVNDKLLGALTSSFEQIISKYEHSDEIIELERPSNNSSPPLT